MKTLLLFAVLALTGCSSIDTVSGLVSYGSGEQTLAVGGTVKLRHAGGGK